MKRILILDVDSCADCPCTNAEQGWLGDIVRSYCQATGKNNLVYLDGTGTPQWCPLNPLPETKDAGYPNEDYDVGFGDGWDACLKEILGETV